MKVGGSYDDTADAATEDHDGYNSLEVKFCGWYGGSEWVSILWEGGAVEKGRNGCKEGDFINGARVHFDDDNWGHDDQGIVALHFNCAVDGRGSGEQYWKQVGQIDIDGSYDKYEKVLEGKLVKAVKVQVLHDGDNWTTDDDLGIVGLKFLMETPPPEAN